MSFATDHERPGGSSHVANTVRSLDSFIGQYNDRIADITGYDLIMPKQMPDMIRGQTRPLTRYGTDGVEIAGSEIDINQSFWDLDQTPENEQEYVDVMWHELLHGYQFDFQAEDDYQIGTESLEDILPLQEGQAVFNGDNRGYEEAKHLYSDLFYDNIKDLSPKEIQERTGENVALGGEIDLYDVDDDTVEAYAGSLLEEISEEYRIDVVGLDAGAGQPLYDFVVTDRDMLDDAVSEEDIEQFIYTKYEVETEHDVTVMDDMSYEVDYRDESVNTEEIGRYLVDVQEAAEQALEAMADENERLPTGAMANDITTY